MFYNGAELELNGHNTKHLQGMQGTEGPTNIA